MDILFHWMHCEIFNASFWYTCINKNLYKHKFGKLKANFKYGGTKWRFADCSIADSKIKEI